MKNSILILAILACFASIQDVSAQLSKKEKKEWKKKQKSMNPSDFKDLVEENISLKSKLSSLNNQVSGLQAKVSDSESMTESLRKEKLRLETELLEFKSSDRSMDVSGNKTKAAKGMVFKVQIGAYIGKDLSQFVSSNDDMAQEVAGNVQKYTLGTFTDYWQADKFKKHLRRMGVKDAWIVPYKDGSRVPMKDVLEGVI
ncbi:MAG: Ezrin/radixin/moesin family protein [Bacteroidota bacterium]|nr:Ezrin/radixin/moesin family protein [Bacteroidota bacterium]